MPRDVGREHRDRLCRDAVSLASEFGQNGAHIGDVLQQDGIGEEVQILDVFVLGLWVVLGNDAVPTEMQPLGEAIVAFNLVGFALNLVAKLKGRDVLEELRAIMTMASFARCVAPRGCSVWRSAPDCGPR